MSNATTNQKLSEEEITMILDQKFKAMMARSKPIRFHSGSESFETSSHIIRLRPRNSKKREDKWIVTHTTKKAPGYKREVHNVFSGTHKDCKAWFDYAKKHTKGKI